MAAIAAAAAAAIEVEQDSTDMHNTYYQNPKATENGVTAKKSPATLDYRRNRYPHCIVWTPIPLLTWIFPFIGHMGIAYTSGIIRDFAGPYYVSEDDMAFGNPTRYLQMSLENLPDGK